MSTRSETLAPAPARILETVLAAITDFAYAFDLDGRFIYVNKPLLDLWGLTLDQAVGKNFFDLLYPRALAAKLQRQIQLVIATKSRLVDETPYTSPTGVAGYYEYIFTPVLAADGSVEIVAGSTRDISARKHAERDRDNLLAALDAEGAKLASLIDSAPAFICTLRGPDHVFELTNRHYDDLIGHRPAVGRTVRDVFPDLAGQGFFEILDRVYQTGQPFVGNELPVAFSSPSPSRPAVELRYLNFVYQPTRDAAGAVTGIFVHGVDVTDLVRARDAIRESESRFRQLADAMPQIVFAATPDGHVDYFNQRWYEYTGLPAGSVGYDSWKHVHTEDGLAKVSARWAESLATGEPYEIEYRLRRHDGEFRWHLGRALPVRDDAGRIVRWFGTNTDIHDQKLLEIERAALLASERQARADAETANQAKDRFLATLSHELRTPLTPVAMVAAAMEADPALPAEFRDDVAMIRRNVQLETQLIDDLLDLSRIMSGKMRLRPQPTDAHRLVRHVLETVGAELHDKRLTVQTDLSAGSHDVHADAARLQQALWNLLKNAAKFTPQGGTVTVRTRNDPPNRLAIEVADTGKGIPPDALARIFEPFEQGDHRITARFGGLGLGLSIAKAVADLHDGTLRADSPGEGRGATFTLTLPLCRVPATQPPVRDEPDPATLGRPLRVLLVEDHPDTARTLTRLLRLDGMEVQCAGTVAAGLRLAADSPFDVIVSDLGLPDGSGHDLMRRLRTDAPAAAGDARRAVGIAMSGYGMEEDIRQSQDAGFAEHLVKPVNLADLRQAIRRAAARFGPE